jgi:transposase-like protein
LRAVLYGIVYLDALVVKMRHEGGVENRAVFVAIGVTVEGAKEVLGLWTNSLAYVNWKERKAVAEDLRGIYRAATEEAGLAALEHFEECWNSKYAGDREAVAAALVGHQSPIRVSGRDTTGNLHDQRR